MLDCGGLSELILSIDVAFPESFFLLWHVLVLIGSPYKWIMPPSLPPSLSPSPALPPSVPPSPDTQNQWVCDPHSLQPPQQPSLQEVHQLSARHGGQEVALFLIHDFSCMLLLITSLSTNSITAGYGMAIQSINLPSAVCFTVQPCSIILSLTIGVWPSVGTYVPILLSLQSSWVLFI